MTNEHAERFAFYLAPGEGDEDGPGLSPLAALGCVANDAADDWLRAHRPDLWVHPMGAYPEIARAVVLALADDIEQLAYWAPNGVVLDAKDRLRALLAEARGEPTP